MLLGLIGSIIVGVVLLVCLVWLLVSHDKLVKRSIRLESCARLHLERLMPCEDGEDGDECSCCSHHRRWARIALGREA